MGTRLKVGVIGLQAERSWAARAHIPALRTLGDDYEVVGVANTTAASATTAATALGLRRAFADVGELVTSPEIDIVAVTVRVPAHYDIVVAALEAGKHVYCEWPLGNGLGEAERLTALARSSNVLGVIGTQARVAPEIQYLRDMVKDGELGEILSTTVTAFGGGWGGFIPDWRNGSYLMDRANGATMLTIPVAHALSALREVLGDVSELNAVLATRRKEAIITDTQETIAVSAPDQVLVNGTLASGAPMSLHYRGGMPKDPRGFTWEINGTKGDIRVVASFGHPQLLPLSIEAALGSAKDFSPFPTPTSYQATFPSDPTYGNVARVYAQLARDIREGTATAPTFDDAVSLHRLIVSIEESALTGRRIKTAEFRR